MFISERHYLGKGHRRESESLVCTSGRTDLVIHPFLSVSPSYHEMVTFATQLQCYNAVSHLKTQGIYPTDTGLKLWKRAYINLCTFKHFLSRYLSQRKKKKNRVTQTVNFSLLDSFGHALASYYNLTYHSPPAFRPLYVLWNSFSEKFCYPLGSAQNIFGKDQTIFSDLWTH